MTRHVRGVDLAAACVLAPALVLAIAGARGAVPPDLLGIAASSISFVLWVPQALAVYRMRRDAHALAGIAIGIQLLVLANAALWFAYAGVLGSFWVGAPGLINAPLSAVIIALVLRARASAGLDHSPTGVPGVESPRLEGADDGSPDRLGRY